MSAMARPGSEQQEISLDGDDMLVADQLYAWGWTDGLPVVPPTKERVARFCAAALHPPEHVLGSIAPRGAPISVRQLAANAVMAGCLPSYMPILEAAIAAMNVDGLNLYGMQMTTHPCALMVLVHGPAAADAGMNSGAGCMGQGNRANGTIGRAVRLVMMNVGGARPGDGETEGELDRATQGTPAKWSFCFAENEARSPWEPFRVSVGLAKDDSAVTVAAVEGPHNINDHQSDSGEELLFTIAETMSTPGANTLYQGGDQFVVLGPEHAEVIAKSGFSRQAAQQYLFEHARVSLDRIGKKKLDEASTWGGYKKRLEEWNGRIPVARAPEDIRILVAGGAGKHSVWLPTFGATSSQTSRIGLEVPGRVQLAPPLPSSLWSNDAE
jgi:hypothetical protein